MSRARKTWQHWSPAQDEWLARLRGEGRTADQIAREMARTVPAVKQRAAAVRARKRERWEAWLEVLAEPRPIRQTAALMRVGVHAVKQMARKLRRAGFDVPKVRKRRAVR